MEKKNILFLAIAGVVILLDQVTKHWILTSMRLHDAFPVIDGLFNIVYVRNPGAAFGFLASASPLFRILFFLAVTLIAILFILHYLKQTRTKEIAVIVSLSLILAGAVGNMIDRIRFGEVIDFLDVYVDTYHWPAFNVADSAITTGASILVFFLLGRRKEDGRQG